MLKAWKMKSIDEGKVTRLVHDLRVPPLIARLLIHRGADSAQEAGRFLCEELSSLPDPARMKNLSKAVALIRRALSGGKKILVVGDYDVDGMTSAAVLIRTLRERGGKVSWHIPHRQIDGYGLKEPVLQEAARSGVKLVLCVDCGTTSFEELGLARRLGLETVVADHHELLAAGPPPASAFLNPLQPGCRYPNKELASVGVAFTLARGLAESVPGTGAVPGTVFDHLDLVALGTVADLSPLVGENRILVKAGLHRLQGSRKPGLKTLLSHTRLAGIRLTAEEISYVLAPRLNAMGRVGSAESSLRLLITEDPNEACSIVKEMDHQNKERVALEKEATRRALTKVEREINFARDRVIVLEDERWHPGVAGIIASRLANRFQRPAVVIARSGPACRGSARSIRSFHLLEALEQVREHLLEFGGHPAAAGLTIEREKVGAFREALNRVAHRRIDPEALAPCLEIDGELPLSSLTDELMRDLEQLAPFGAGNPWPVFVSEDAQIPAESPQRVPYSHRGIRFLVEDSQGRPFHALQPLQDAPDGWNVRRLRGGPIRLAYSPVRSREKEGGSIELRVRDLKLPA